MPSYWLKLHTDILGDPKLMSAAAEHGDQHLDLMPWVFAYAKLVNQNGRVFHEGTRENAALIAALMPNGRPQEVGRCLAELEALGILTRPEGGGLVFTHWAYRNGNADAPSNSREAWAERKRKSRDRSRSVTRDIPRDVSRPVTAIEVDADAEIDTERARETARASVTTPVTTRDSEPNRYVQALLDKLGDTDRARGTITAFLDNLPPGQPALRWIATLDAGILGGLQMPGNREATPNQLLTAIEQFPLISPPMPLTPANLIACVARVARDEAARASRPSSTSTRAPTPNPNGRTDAQQAAAMAQLRINTHRDQLGGGEAWWADAQAAAKAAGAQNYGEILVWVAKNLVS